MRAGTKNKPKIFLTNLAGFFLLLLVPFIGPLPGPGGIPLLYAGLNLLSINNLWAKRLKDFVDEKSLGVGDLIFSEDKKHQWAWDIFIVLSFSAGVGVLIIYDLHPIWQTAITTIMGFTVLAWFRNRHRWQRLSKYLKAKRSKERKRRKKS